MQKLETSLLKSMIPIVKMSDKLLELKSNSKSASESDLSEFLQLSLDSLALMGHPINEVNTKRRELIKPDLNDQFKQLCGSHTPVTKLLFGDDLPNSSRFHRNHRHITTNSRKDQTFLIAHTITVRSLFLWKYQGPGKRSHLDLTKKGKPDQH